MGFNLCLCCQLTLPLKDYAYKLITQVLVKERIDKRIRNRVDAMCRHAKRTCDAHFPHKVYVLVSNRLSLEENHYIASNITIFF